MKIAISTDAGFVSAHFGRCPSFTIAEIEEGKVLKIEEINNPGHQPAFLPNFLAEYGVEYIICGGMGNRAQMLFAEKKITPVIGVTGKIEEVIEKFVQGKLKGGESFCKPGAGKGYGIEKEECDHSGEDNHFH
ncbi:MAG: dinitrogenase iron-molybdenum cofactor [Candidatus Infernicultor aquiphilus]|uniref:Dinitrogenase iron-molybdenum cofactor n=1 Tax=Candidatus Infernicultor aquiphilus TaxID=1805029 RepID=A0A1J5G911_9BACT|nr:dinitrogenase iron-molybdenum cofactor [bacterium]OIP69157.1 MAG: dinitrogenase iron-molybdenum cofactor [Candidatus Atribacteria bacterium CG2_30_33_13]PIU24919.1 MAG: dinitrogenase iron-molybdenum cofactor [Candidatus Atribacteria bacterium CG08_land_8_20_14_0_20_33_29]PIW12175.1 MAG: dinitrogenase iron-molybdenum cofactor [Candidatus Atribacteria bacterium CG17_big_fil_post_rev_8_21_14_2_50_34_11]PIX34514.1 MAG: dinitrogenase iron-molybdenum cofactor [Candidatus Atribacteria bacterium CG_